MEIVKSRQLYVKKNVENTYNETSTALIDVSDEMYSIRLDRALKIIINNYVLIRVIRVSSN